MANLQPLREDYFELDRHVHFVHVEDKRREAFAELLESHRFQEVFDSREEIIGTFLPFYIDTKQKTFRTAGNVTSAASAATHRIVMTEEEFMIIFKRDTIGK